MEILFLLFCLLINSSVGQEVAVIRSLSSSIGDVVLECQSEMHFDNKIVRNFLNFWNEKDELVEKDMGCVLLCVFMKMELMDHGGHVQKEETEAFLRAMGADDKVTNKIVELFQLCQRATGSVKEVCEYALQMTKCFRYGIFQLHWAPQYVKPNITEMTRKRRGNHTMENSMKKIDMFMKDGTYIKPSRRRGRKDGRRYNKNSGI